MGTRCANHVTPLYPQKLALTSLTGGGHSVGMVRSRTKATEFSFFLVSIQNASMKSHSDSNDPESDISPKIQNVGSTVIPNIDIMGFLVSLKHRR